MIINNDQYIIYIKSFIEGYCSAIEDIKNNLILNENFNYSNQKLEIIQERIDEHRKLFIKGIVDDLKSKNFSNDVIKNVLRTGVGISSNSKYINKKKIAERFMDKLKDKDTRGKYMSAIGQINMSGSKKGIGNIYDKADKYENEGNKEKSNELIKGLETDSKKALIHGYKYLVSPKYDKESKIKKILKGDIKGAMSKLGSEKISELRKHLKKTMNTPYTPSYKYQQDPKKETIIDKIKQNVNDKKKKVTDNVNRIKSYYEPIYASVNRNNNYSGIQSDDDKLTLNDKISSIASAHDKDTLKDKVGNLKNKAYLKILKKIDNK